MNIPPAIISIVVFMHDLGVWTDEKQTSIMSALLQFILSAGARIASFWLN